MKKVLALTLTMTIFIFSFLIPLVAEAQIAPEPPDVDALGPVVFSHPGGRVVIFSPKNSLNYSNQIQLVFAVQVSGLFGQFGNVGVSLDGGVVYSVTNFLGKSVVETDTLYVWSTTVLASRWLPSLSEGAHNVTVYYGWQYLGTHQRYEVFAYATADFMVVNADATNVSTAVSDMARYTQPEMAISSPLNKTYNSSSLPLNSTLSYGYLIATNASVCYSLDGKDNITASGGKLSIENAETILTPYNLEIDNLSDGSHNLTVYAEITYLYYGAISDFSSVQFTIDTSPPTISLSIMNKTYNMQTIPLSFNVDENTSWVAYNLDNQENTTMQGNMTLTGLSEGPHNIVVYANDTLGNMGKSDTIFFTVNTSAAEGVTPATVLSGIVVIAVAVGLLVYFRKRNHARINKHSETEQSSK